MICRGPRSHRLSFLILLHALLQSRHYLAPRCTPNPAPFPTDSSRRPRPPAGAHTRTGQAGGRARTRLAALPRTPDPGPGRVLPTRRPHVPSPHPPPSAALFSRLQPPSHPLGDHPAPRNQTSSFGAPAPLHPTPRGSPLTRVRGHSHPPAADPGAPASSWPPRARFQEDRLPPGLLPSPGVSSLVAPGSWGGILRGFQHWGPPAASLPLLKGEPREAGGLGESSRNPGASHRNSAVPRLLGLVAAARSFPPASLSLSLFPPCSLFRSFFFFFLEGQVLTFHGLLATASTSLSNRRAGDGPHRGDRAGKEASRNPHPRLLVMRRRGRRVPGGRHARGEKRGREDPGESLGQGQRRGLQSETEEGKLKGIRPEWERSKGTE